MASFAPDRILIFGGTGQIGRFVTSSLLRAKPAFPNIVLFTSPNTVNTKASLLTKWKGQGLSIVEGDITEDEDVKAAYSGVDTVISCLGRGVLEHQIKLLQLAEASASVKWFFPSEYGTDIEHNAESRNEKPHQLKLKVRALAREYIKRVKVTYVVTGPYFDMWVNPVRGYEVAGGYDIATKRAYVVEEGEGKVGFCTMWDVGKSVVAALRHPEESFGKALRVQSFVVSPNEVLAEYERQTGVQWQVTKTSLNDIKTLEDKLWAEGVPEATFITLRRIWAEGGTLYEKNDNDAIGLKPGDMEPLSVGLKRAIQGSDETF